MRSASSFFWLFCLLLLASATARAQVAAWQNVHVLAVPGSVGRTVAANGSIYVVGVYAHFVKTHDPESGGLAITGENAFVAKWDPATHRLVWLVEMGNQYGDKEEPTAIVVHDSSVYVLGQFRDRSQGFGYPVRATGWRDAFVTRLTDHGTHATANWTQALGYPECETWAQHLAYDGTAIYVAGTRENMTNFDRDPMTGERVPHLTHAFVAKLTDTGAQGLLGWQRTWQVNKDYHAVVALAARRGQLYLATTTWRPTPYPTKLATEPGQGTLPPHADYRLHLTRMGDQGAGYCLDWTHTEAGQGTGLALTDEALYVVGRADADQAFGHPRPAPDPGDAPGDLFVAKLLVADTTVQTAWVHRLPGTGHDYEAQLPYVAVRGRQVYLAGRFGTPRLVLDSLVLRNADPYAHSNRNLFVAQLTDAGGAARFDWAQRMGNGNAADLGDFALDGTRLYLSSFFQGDRDTPVLLGKQQFLPPTTYMYQVRLQSWLPLDH